MKINIEYSKSNIISFDEGGFEVRISTFIVIAKKHYEMNKSPN
jgi:hypothetical protein